MPRIVIRAIEEFFSNQCLMRAGALAFATLFALVPIAAIFFFIATKLEGFSDIEDRVRSFLFRNLAPAQTDVISDYLTQYTKNVAVLGIFGLIVLVITAIFLFNTIEHTFNSIWHAEKRRPFLAKLTSFWTVLTVTPILIGLSSYIAVRLSIKNIEFLPFWFLTYVLNCLAFWFLYQFAPYTHVHVRAAAVGAVVGGALWTGGKAAFRWYISNITTFNQIYGSLGAIPVFLLWLYLTWLIVLFGSEIAYAVQYPESKAPSGQPATDDYLEFYSVRTMAEIIRLFSDGVKETTDNKMHRLHEIGVPADVLEHILNRLSEEKLVVFTEDRDYVPARHPSRITVREVIEAVTGKKLVAPDDVNDPLSLRLRKTFQKVGKGVDSALDELNFQNLLDGNKE